MIQIRYSAIICLMTMIIIVSTIGMFLAGAGAAAPQDGENQNHRTLQRGKKCTHAYAGSLLLVWELTLCFRRAWVQILALLLSNSVFQTNPF